MTERMARGLVIGTLVVLVLITGALYVSADDNPVLHVCHEMGVQVADADLTETAQELAADNSLTLPQVFSGAWKAGAVHLTACNVDADTTQTSWSPTDEVFDFAAVSTFDAWLTGAQPVDWDALWEEYSIATRPAPTPPQEGDYCRAHGIQIIDLTDYSTARQIAAETGLALDGVFYWSRVTDNPFTEVCNPDFEAELAAHSAGTRAEGGRPTVQVLDAPNAEALLAVINGVLDGTVRAPVALTDAIADAPALLGGDDASKPPVEGDE